jgi:hypothetical protein
MHQLRNSTEKLGKSQLFQPADCDAPARAKGTVPVRVSSSRRAISASLNMRATTMTTRAADRPNISSVIHGSDGEIGR